MSLCLPHPLSPECEQYPRDESLVHYRWGKGEVEYVTQDIGSGAETIPSAHTSQQHNSCQHHRPSHSLCCLSRSQLYIEQYWGLCQRTAQVAFTQLKATCAGRGGSKDD